MNATIPPEVNTYEYQGIVPDLSCISSILLAIPDCNDMAHHSNALTHEQEHMKNLMTGSRARALARAA